MNWIDKKNVSTVVIGILFCVLVGRFTETISPPMEEVKQEVKATKTPFIYPVKRMKVTAYCPCEKCCGKFSDGKTSTGANALVHLGVAADPAVLRYGTKLKIPGIGVRIVDDTGGALRQSTKKGICHIDVRFHSHEDAKEFGVQWLNVEILSPTM